VVEEPGLLQRAALPCHVRPAVPAQKLSSIQNNS
jgi:hypothetical protein